MNFASVELADGQLRGGGLDIALPIRLQKAVESSGHRTFDAGFRPEHLEIGGAGDGLTIHAKADVVEYLGNDELLHVTVPGHEGDVIALVPAIHNVHPGDSVDLHLPAARLHLFETESGGAITTDAA